MHVDFRVLRLVAGLCLLIAVTSVNSHGQNDQQKDGRYYESMALKAYQQKDYAQFLANMKQAAELRPNHPRLMYNLAVAFALNGRQADAVHWLRKTAAMGLVFAAAGDHDFDSLKESAEFKSVLKQFEQNKSPKVHSFHAFTVHEKGLVPESVAYDQADEVFYLSSVYKRKILRITKKGEVTTFAGESDGLWSVMGMKVDAARRFLWVCTAAHAQMTNYRKEDEGKSALFKFDLQSGKLIARYQPADTTKPHWLGDLVINSQGDVFATDSVTPAIYVVRHNQTELETFVAGQPFVSPQGLDFTRDQRHLFVADYAKGVFVVDIETRKVTNITADFTLLGIDGLYFHRGTLLCVQNGVNPARLIRLFPNKELTRFERFQTVEANNPVFDEPTLGVLVKDDFYFVANSQWGAIDRTGQLASEDKLRDPTVLRLRL